MTPNMKRAILSFLFVCACAVAGPDDAARGLIGRVVPKHAARFVVETIPAEQGRDVFEIESRGGPFDDAQGRKIVLRGNNGVAVASALNHYLKNF